MKESGSHCRTSPNCRRLLINDSVLIDHDGLHGSAVEKTATVSLAAGDHPFTVDYFEYSVGENLAVFIEGPDMPKQLIPTRILFRP
ncbi:hypothetical protein KAH55_01715 [bacterium]|nr:hypothetical protein [bacterium]